MFPPNCGAPKGAGDGVAPNGAGAGAPNCPGVGVDPNPLLGAGADDPNGLGADPNAGAGAGAACPKEGAGVFPNEGAPVEGALLLNVKGAGAGAELPNVGADGAGAGAEVPKRISSETWSANFSSSIAPIFTKGARESQASA